MKDHEIETLLSQLAPLCASPELNRQVAHEMELDRQWMRSPTRRRSAWAAPALWSSLGAAAAVLVMNLSAPSASSPVTNWAIASPSVIPVSTLREVVEAQNEGIRYNRDSRLPEQHVKLLSLERHAWIDPRDGAQITVEMPREDSVILPVSFQ